MISIHISERIYITQQLIPAIISQQPVEYHRNFFSRNVIQRSYITFRITYYIREVVKLLKLCQRHFRIRYYYRRFRIFSATTTSATSVDVGYRVATDRSAIIRYGILCHGVGDLFLSLQVVFWYSKCVSCFSTIQCYFINFFTVRKQVDCYSRSRA